MNGYAKSTRMRKRLTWIAALVAVVFVPAAQADDDWDDYEYYDDGSEYDSYAPHNPWAGPYQRSGAVGHMVFEPLHGYGDWRWVSHVGAYLWFPYVEASWRPYFYGHWIHTPRGMTWVSYEPWGEIPHHYGRWVFVDRAGWGWIPGYDYAPAWVTWGVVNDCIGWAPLPPAGYRYPRYHRYRGYGHPARYGHGGSFYYHSSGINFEFWVFVTNHHFYGSRVYEHALPVRNTLSLFKHKKVLPIGNNLHVDYVKKVSKHKIETVKLDRRTKTVGGRDLVLHTPRGQHDKVKSAQKAVKRVVSHDVRRAKSPTIDAERRDRRETPKSVVRHDRRDVQRDVVKKKVVKHERRETPKQVAKQERRETPKQVVKQQRREAPTPKKVAKQERREAPKKVAKQEQRESRQSKASVRKQAPDRRTKAAPKTETKTKKRKG